MKVYIIAEAGVNHNGDIRIAKKLIDSAKEAGADCIKFQTFKAENLVSKKASKADYQKNTGDEEESQYEMLKKLQLSYDDFIKLNEYCNEIGIDFLSTAFDDESIEFLKSLDMKVWKIPSGELTNLPYLIKVAQIGKPIILSTGMSEISDIEESVNVLRNYGCVSITILHCTTEYPTPYDEVNLKAMDHIKRSLNAPVGYSDHTMGIEVPIAAVALGANVIEKHFTLDRSMVGPDHKASLEPDELKLMVKSIRNIESALGTGEKTIVDSERKNIVAARKSIVAKKIIKCGEVFTEDNITTKRPGNGVSPMKWFDVIGSISTKDYKEDEMIDI